MVPTPQSRTPYLSLMFRSVPVSLALAVLCASTARADNDSSCDIGVAPAATLLLPYFETDFSVTAKNARMTIFTITNVSAQQQIAHITLWTDWAGSLNSQSRARCRKRLDDLG